MTRHKIGQLLLILATVLIILAGGSLWFNKVVSGIATATFLIALILTGAGAYLSKKESTK